MSVNTSTLACLLVVLALGCDGERPPYPGGCYPSEDADGDGIHRGYEEGADTDGDGLPDEVDLDSDDDGVPDAVERGDGDCLRRPADTDLDGTPDFRDLDSNGDGLSDTRQSSGDLDGDGVDDRADIDLDGDGILNSVEAGSDSDGDGTPDVADLDSDADRILDGDEHAVDSDRDGQPNYRDLDSDADGTPDVAEAGDTDLDTPPVSCPDEVDPTSVTADPEVPPRVVGDGVPDFADADSDNDGVGDAEEMALGTLRCGYDTDADGLGDLVESAYERTSCRAGIEVACGCATDPTCALPSDDYFVVLPFEGEPVRDSLTFSTTVRGSSVFFLLDSTASTQHVIDAVTETIAEPDTGLLARIAGGVPGASFGAGVYRDFPLTPYGSPDDEAFQLLPDPSTPTSALRLVEAADAMRLAAAFRTVIASGGGDGPASATEAMYQTLTGEGGTWTSRFGDATYSLPSYRDFCLDDQWGAPCFPAGTLPVLVHFFDYCSHAGPAGESARCTDYEPTIVDPLPHSWDEMIDVAAERGMKYVAINTGSESCVGVSARSSLPCYFARRTAEATSSVDVDGNPSVYDLPSETTRETFVETIVSAVTSLATRVPLDIDTATRDDPADSEGVDATRFITLRAPGCVADMPVTPCYTAVPGEEDVAVGGMDGSTFYRVLPGTRVVFRVDFRNAFLEPTSASRVFVAHIDVRGDHAVRLDSRTVYVVIPAATGSFVE